MTGNISAGLLVGRLSDGAAPGASAVAAVRARQAAAEAANNCLIAQCSAGAGRQRERGRGRRDRQRVATGAMGDWLPLVTSPMRMPAPPAASPSTTSPPVMPPPTRSMWTRRAPRARSWSRWPAASRTRAWTSSRPGHGPVRDDRWQWAAGRCLRRRKVRDATAEGGDGTGTGGKARVATIPSWPKSSSESVSLAPRAACGEVGPLSGYGDEAVLGRPPRAAGGSHRRRPSPSRGGASLRRRAQHDQAMAPAAPPDRLGGRLAPARAVATDRPRGRASPRGPGSCRP